MTTLNRVTQEIVELHDFFVDWFTGKADRDQLEPRVLSRLHKDLLFIAPEGAVMTSAMLKGGFEQGFGSNPDFRIQIRDVKIHHERGSIVLATYTEWQTGAMLSAQPNNARFTSVLMDMADPVTWLHLQETWLPEPVRAAGPFDF